MNKKVFIISIVIVLAVLFLGYCQHINTHTKVRFNLHALSRYLHAYQLVEKKSIQSLSDLPDFHLVSYPHSLEVKAADLRGRVLDGYFYDFKRCGDDKFIISASPLMLWPFSVEFAVLEDMNLRFNRYGVDSQSETCDEVAQWMIFPEWFRIQTSPESS